MLHSINDLQLDHNVLADELTAAMQKFFASTVAKDTDNRIHTDVVISVRSFDTQDPSTEPLVVEKIEGMRINLDDFGRELMVGAILAPALFPADDVDDSAFDFIELK